MKSPFYFVHSAVFLIFLFLSAYCLPSISHAEDDPELEKAISYMQYKLVSDIWPKLQEPILKEGKKLNFSHLQLMDEIALNKKFGTPIINPDALVGHLSMSIEELDQVRALEAANDVKYTRALKRLENITDIVDIVTLGTKTYSLAENFSKAIDRGGNLLSREEAALKGISDLFDAYVASIGVANLAARNIPKSVIFKFWAKNSLATGLKETLSKGKVAGPLGLITTLADVEGRIYKALRDSSIEQTIKYITSIHKIELEARERTYQQIIDLYIEKMKKWEPVYPVELYRILEKYPIYRKEFSLIAPDVCRVADVYWDFLYKHNKFLQDSFGKNTASELTSRELVYAATQAMVQISVFEDNEINQFIYEKITNNSTFTDIIFGAFQGSDIYEIYNTDDLQNTLFPYRNSSHQFNLINKKTSSGAYGYYTVVYLAALHTAVKNAEMEMAYEIGRRIKLLRQKAEEKKRAEEYALEHQVTIVTSPNVQYESGLITADIGEQITLTFRSSFLEDAFYNDDYRDDIKNGLLPVTVWATMEDGSDHTFTGAWDSDKNGFIFTVDTANPFYLTGMTHQFTRFSGGEERRCGFSFGMKKHVVDQSVVALPPKDPECPAGATDIACAVGAHQVAQLKHTGFMKDIFVEGDYAYIADSDFGLQILDISSPVNPKIISSLNISGSPNGIQISGNYAYITDHDFGLHVVDVREPYNPALTGSVNTPGTARGIQVVGNYAYIADWESGLQIVDITIPEHPFVISTIETGNYVSDVSVAGGYAYLAHSYSGFLVINIEDPSAPFITGTLDYSGNFSKIIIDGNYAYILDKWFGLQIVDVSNPNAPSLLTSLDVNLLEAQNIALSANYVYVTDAKGFGLHIIDINNPENPSIAASLATPGTALGISVIENYAYIASGYSGFQIFDISNPSSFLVGSLVTDETDTAHRINAIKLSENYLYAARSDFGLQVFDIHDPFNLSIIGSLDTPGRSYDVEIVEKYAYIADGNSGFQVFDIQDPTLPLQVGSLGISGSALDVSVVGNFAYIAAYSGGLQVVDISNPLSPFITGSINFGSIANAVSISGEFAFIANGSLRGLQIANISNPSNPTFTGSLYTPGSANDIAVLGDYAYIADGDSGLQIIDISNPSSPSLLSSLVSGYAKHITIVEHYAFLSVYNDNIDEFTVHIVDVSNPDNPLLVGILDTPGYPNDINITGNIACIADGNAVLLVDWQKLIQNTQLINSYYHPKISLSLTAETPSDYQFNAAPFTKTWTFSEDITNLSVTVQTDNYANRGSFTKNGNQLSVTLTPDTTIPINELTLQFTDSGGNTVQVDHSDTFWCISRTNHAPELANGQITQMVSNFSEPAELDIRTYDVDGDTVTISIIDDDGGYALFDPDNPTKLVASFSDQEPIHTLRIRLDDGKETVDKEIVVLRFDSDTVADFYSDVPDSHPYQADIAFATLKGVVWGQPDSSDNQKRIYRPDDPASMAEMLKIVLNAAANSGKITLPDERYYLTALPSWVGPYYTYAVKTEALDFQGTDLGQEHPTRETVAKFIAKVLGLDVKLASFDTLSSEFNDADQFSTLRTKWYGQAVHAFGLFMAGDNANPQGTVNRGELARVVSRIFMMPSADLTTPDTVEYGTAITVSPLQNIHAEKINASLSLIDSSNEVTAAYSINGHVFDGTAIDPVYLHSGVNTLIGALRNQGILNMYSKEITVTFTDTDVDGVQDTEDAWPNDDRYAKDVNGNSIPDRLDYLYGLQDKTPSDSVVINGETMLISDLISNGPPEDVDSDGDGVYDNFDNCPYHANTNQADYDGDELGDECDPDDDNDGMNDGWEEINGFDPYDANDASLDSDGDGFTTKQEHDFGSNPNQFNEDANNNGIPDSVEHGRSIAPILQLLLF